jgi:hypothetical protein
MKQDRSWASIRIEAVFIHEQAALSTDRELASGSAWPPLLDFVILLKSPSRSITIPFRRYVLGVTGAASGVARREAIYLPKRDLRR